MIETEINTKPYILVVDDILKNLKVIGNILLENDYEISLVSNGFEALESLKSDKPDLILLDIMMPEMDGYEACRRIKENPTTADIPIIFITAKSETEDIVEAFRAGGVDYLTKPFNREELLVRVKTHIDLKRSRDESKLHATQMTKLNEQLSAINNEKQALLNTLEEDLRIASEYIESLLPNKVDNTLIKSDWMFIPATTLGGDSFGFHWVDDDHLAMYLLDVCGHGVGPALHSVSVLNNLRSQILPDTDFTSPKSVISNLNQVYQMRNHNNIYFTMWYGVYNKINHKMKYASAGHPPALLLNSTDDAISLFTRNYVIGAEAIMGYVEEEVDVKKGAKLYIFSDGTYEVFKTDRVPWDVESLHLFLKEKNGAGKDELKELYSHQVKVNGSPNLEDDFSILKIVFK